jgi:O-acetyl-ADP-ribose deacetylase (regulator of RNase III)
VEIEVVRGDLTDEDVDAIVNAANSSLLGGGGVDGAIHRAGGPEILEVCREIRRTQYPDGLPTGQAVATTGGRLKARWVIHTAGPIYDAHDPSDGGDYPAFGQPARGAVGAASRSSDDDGLRTRGSRLHLSPQHLLKSCHVESLRVADELGARSVSFPAISCGAYGYPLHEAAPIAITSVREADTDVELVRFVLFGDDAFAAFSSAVRS